MRNSNPNRIPRLIATLGICAALTSIASAQTPPQPAWSQWGSIVQIESGWVVDSMAIRHSVAAVANPGGCRITNAGYVTNPADPGHNLFHTLLLSAFLNKKEVAVLVHECFADKPRIVDVAIR